MSASGYVLFCHHDNFGDKYDGIIYDEGGDPADGGDAFRAAGTGRAC